MRSGQDREVNKTEELKQDFNTITVEPFDGEMGAFPQVDISGRSTRKGNMIDLSKSNSTFKTAQASMAQTS